MEIIDYFKSDKPGYWLSEIKKSDWQAAETLARFIEEKTFHDNLGEGTLLLLADSDKLVSFLTFAEKDCIDDERLSPWVGFVNIGGTGTPEDLSAAAGKLQPKRKLPKYTSAPTMWDCTKNMDFPTLKAALTFTAGTAAFILNQFHKEN